MTSEILVDIKSSLDPSFGQFTDTNLLNLKCSPPLLQDEVSIASYFNSPGLQKKIVLEFPPFQPDIICTLLSL